MVRTVSRVAVLVLAAALLPAPAAAPADATGNSALGIPCVPGPNAVRICSATLANRVPTFDGVPLDVEVTLPPPSFKAPYPLIAGLHGFGTAKQAGLDSNQATKFAARGYATLVYSARGIALSCGIAASRTAGCEKGWIHLADSRYEVRDTQHLAGLLLDEGLVKPKIGATGTSYGGGQSLMLATLRDKMVLPSGKVVPWTSPKGVPMEVGAAAPRIGWSDLSQALTPTGHTLDFRAQNPYGPRFGVVNQSYLGVLFFAEAPGFYAPAGKDPEADIYNWKAAFDRGEPYGAVAEAARDQLTKYHSAYYLQDLMSAAQRTVPAPVVIYNGFNDDIMPPAEALRFYNLMRDRYPSTARVGLVFGHDFAHPRGSLAGTPAVANQERDILFDHYLMGDAAAKPLEGVITEPQSCPGGPAGPYRSEDWRSQHPGQVSLTSAAEKKFTSAGGSTVNENATDPFTGGTCPTAQAALDPGSASYQLPPATGAGYTLIGTPTVTANLELTGRFAQIDSRLWDVGPDGRQAMVTDGVFRPDGDGRAVFQLLPSGWYFAPGHAPKLELLGRDAPSHQPSKGDGFSVTVSDLRFDIPVRERPDGAAIAPFAAPELCTPVTAATLRGLRLGPATVGATRAANRRAFVDFRAASAKADRFCVTGGHVRAGYRSARAGALATVLAASSPRFSVNGVRVGRPAAGLRASYRVRVGPTTWLVLRSAGRPALATKTRGGRVVAVGVLDARLARSAEAARAALVALYR